MQVHSKLQKKRGLKHLSFLGISDLGIRGWVDFPKKQDPAYSQNPFP